MGHRVLALDDLEPLARSRLPRPIFGYVSAAAETCATLRANRAVWDQWRFVPRTLVDVRRPSTHVTLFGKRYEAPVGIAPMGGVGMAAYRGDIAMARAAADAGVPMLLSAASLVPMEEVRQAGRTTWLQAYVGGDDAEVDALVRRANLSGFDTICVTTDVPVMGNRENQLRFGFEVPMRPSARLLLDGLARPRWLLGCLARTLVAHGPPHYENMGPRVPVLSGRYRRSGTGRDGLTWAHLRRLRNQWQGPLLVKGLLCAEDVARARSLGLDGVIASNHGGRQLDGSVHPLQVLPELLQAAGGMPVMLDGGVRRGTDVLKALTLGASFVFIGRPMLYAASVAGQAGVAQALALVVAEIVRDMALLGITSLQQLSPRLLRGENGFPASSS